MTMAAPRYLQILNVLSRRMKTGKYPVEMRLPTESELCDEFGASRFTVREALRRLVDQGMVHRRQGAGSVVVAAKPQARYVHSLSSLPDLFQFALDTHYEWLSADQVDIDSDIAADVGGTVGSRWWRVEGLRRDSPDGRVVCYVHSYIPARLGRYVRELKRCVGPFYAHLAERAGEDILELDQTLHGDTMSKNVAKRLQCKRDDIGLRVLRRYITKRGTLIASYNWHVAKDFHYRMTLLRSL
jgi:GntR family transcriptional regulator